MLGFLISNCEWRRAAADGFHLIAALHHALPVEALQALLACWAPVEEYHRVLPLYLHCAPFEAPAEVRGYYRYSKMAAVVDFVQKAAPTGPSGDVIRALDAFAEIGKTWLKVAGGFKADVIDSLMCASPVAEAELAGEYGCFLGYTAVRLARNLLRSAEANGGRCAARMVSFEFDAVHVCCSLFVINLARLRCVAEVWAGFAPWLTPRLVEDMGFRSLGFNFMDHKGTRFHLDWQDHKRMSLVSPTARALVDNVLNPGAPLLLWLCQHWDICKRRSATTNWSLQEHGRDFEDWMVVGDSCAFAPQRII